MRRAQVDVYAPRSRSGAEHGGIATMEYCNDNRAREVESTERPAGNRTSDIVPRAVIRPEALSYHLLRPRSTGPADVPLVGEAYRCWSEVWTETFRELE